jgi:hypothetical protein
VVLGGRRVPVDRPRARTRDGHEVRLDTDTVFAADDLLSQVVMERMLRGWPPAAIGPLASRSAPP